MHFRLATADDSDILRQIYAQYIDTNITFEYDLPSKAEFKSRVESIIAVYPYVVCENESEIIGYAYAHRFQARQAYQWNAELSVYVSKNHTSKGIGRRLSKIVIEILRLQGVRTLYSIITLPNDKSEALHSALGFTRIGTQHNTGYKNGKWPDVGLFEKQIGDYTANPALIKRVNELNLGDLARILQAQSVAACLFTSHPLGS